jgi:Tfp pilus assembly protein PilF
LGDLYLYGACEEMIYSNQQEQAARTLPGRNDDCLCGSGKKSRHCCLKSGAPVVPQQPSPITATICEAHQLFADGKFPQAASLLHNVLAMQPENAEALHYLGLIAHKQGDNIGALSLLNRSLLAAPRNASYFIHVAEVLKDSGDLVRSQEFFQHAVHLESGIGLRHIAHAR